MSYPTSFTEWIDGVIRCSKGVCYEFAEAYAKNPTFALDGCDKAFLYAARFELANEIKESMAAAAEKGVSESEHIAYIKGYLLDNLLTAAAWPKQSNSVTSTHYSQCRTAALGDLLNDWPVEPNEKLIERVSGASEK